MAGPTQAEISRMRAVSDVSEHLPFINLVLDSLGFASEDRARLVRKTEADSKKIFAGQVPFSGSLFNTVAQTVRLKHGTLMGKRHFNQKQDPVCGKEAWIGPPTFLSAGDAQLGSDLDVLISEYGLRDLLHKADVSGYIFGKIILGEKPIGLHLLRMIFNHVEESGAPEVETHDAFLVGVWQRVADCYHSLPEAVQTVQGAHLPGLLAPVSKDVWEEVRAQYEGGVVDNSSTPPKVQPVQNNVMPGESSGDAKKGHKALKPVTPSAVIVRRKTTVRKDNEMATYMSAYEDWGIGREIAALAKRVFELGIKIKINGNTMGEGTWDAIAAGDTVVPKADLERFYEKVADRSPEHKYSSEHKAIGEFLDSFEDSESGRAAAVTTAKEVQTPEVPLVQETAVSDPVISWSEDYVSYGNKKKSLKPKVADGVRKSVHAILCKLRIRVDIRWQELQDLLGEKYSTVSNLGIGTSPMPKERAEKWSSILGISQQTLIGFVEITDSDVTAMRAQFEAFQATKKSVAFKASDASPPAEEQLSTPASNDVDADGSGTNPSDSTTELVVDAQVSATTPAANGDVFNSNGQAPASVRMNDPSQDDFIRFIERRLMGIIPEEAGADVQLLVFKCLGGELQQDQVDPHWDKHEAIKAAQAKIEEGSAELAAALEELEVVDPTSAQTHFTDMLSGEHANQ